MSPAHWPTLTADEAAHEWHDLHTWVGQYTKRYPAARGVALCWWWHNDMVELLAALRDHERACFGTGAPATAAMEWQLARVQVEIQLAGLSKRMTCNLGGRAHPSLEGPGLSEWDAFVEQDVARRRRDQ